MAVEVDRGTFLLLTLSMAGLGCNTGQPPVVSANVVDIPHQPPQPADAGARPAALGPEEPAAKRVELSTPTEEDGDDSAEAVDDDDDGCGWVDPAHVKRPSGTCNDDVGAAPGCAVMKVCAGFAFPRSKCDAYRRVFKPKVAQRAVECLAKLSDKQVCDACNTYRCGDQALKGSCPDPSADAPCAQIVARCKSVSMSDCRLYLSGMNALGRAKMTACLSSPSGCGFGLYSCAEGL